MAKNYLIIFIAVAALLHSTVKNLRLTDDDEYDFYKDNSSAESNINHLSEVTAVTHTATSTDQEAASSENATQENQKSTDEQQKQPATSAGK